MEKNIRLGFVVVLLGTEDTPRGECISYDLRISIIRSTLLSEEEAAVWKNHYEARKAAWEAKVEEMEAKNRAIWDEVHSEVEDRRLSSEVASARYIERGGGFNRGENGNLVTFVEISYDPNAEQALSCVPAVQINEEIHLLVQPYSRRRQGNG